jgi:dsRNA-specific ribonuclease
MFPRSEDGTQDIKTYSDYYRVKKEIDVPSDSILFQAQALWHLPSRRTGLRAAIKEFEDDDETSENGYTLCHGLVSLMLASQACMESRITDPGLYLLCTCLPQFLFQMERCLCAHALIEHTSKILPILSGFLRGLPLTEVVSVLSAKSCQENASYERLEWLGDAVLKLVQTDSIIKSKHLRDSVRQIDEGSLDCLRSMLGSNDCLARRCKRLGIDRFIMTTSLSRSHWLPTPLALSATEAGPIDCSPASCKVYADVVEAILGLAYMHGGYSLAVGVADELQITIPWDDANMGTQRGDCDTAISVDSLLRAVERFTGHRFSCGSEIVLEALTHPTAQSLFTGSYQQLEWVGDAVLCLAVREWVFQNFPECDVKFMVQVETVLVNNETLAFFSMKNGLYEHLLHNDGTLTMRLDAYERSIDHLGRGLWATQPPKAAADVVESVLGAVHIHGGFQCGQRAVLTVLRPVMKMVASLDSYSTERLICHPRKSLLELGDNKVLTIRLDEEDVFSCEYPKAYVLDGGRFTSVHREGKRTIASIDCLGTLVVSVADDIPCSAENRACTLVLTVLRNESGLFRRFCEARALYVNAIQTGGKWRERAIRERL